MPLSVGQEVWIRCTVQPGPFSDELLVTVEAIGGSVAGFVSADELNEGASGERRVRGRVVKIEDRIVEVWINGSFFTTNGLAYVPQEMALAA